MLNQILYKIVIFYFSFRELDKIQEIIKYYIISAKKNYPYMWK